MPRIMSTTSITQLKARRKVWMKYLEAISVFLLQACRNRFPNLPRELFEIRARISQAEKSNVLYNQFYQEIVKLVPNLHDIIVKNIETHIDFLKLDLESDVKEPIFALWIFLLKLMFEKPILIMQKEDDQEGKLACIIRERLCFFIASCMPLPSTLVPLTEKQLETQSQHSSQ